MTHDDYQQMWSMYADVDETCRGVHEANSTDASNESLRRLVGLFHDQQREPEQIPSFIRHLGGVGRNGRSHGRRSSARRGGGG